MNIWISALLALSSLEVAFSSSSYSPACQQFSAIFLSSAEATIDVPSISVGDPKLTFFKERLKYRDEDIEHTIEDTFKFLNETYGLHFFHSVPNEQNEYFFENATIRPYYISDKIVREVHLSNWIQTGSTRSTRYRIYDGGFDVIFIGDQTLYGSYGGADGKPGGPSVALVYAFRFIDVCPQSPIIIQFQNASPFRREPIDGFVTVNFDVYSRVLGHGKIEGVQSVKPHPDEPGRYLYSSRQVATFRPQ